MCVERLRRPEVGQWDLAFSFLMLVAPLAVLGIPGSFGRYIAHYEMRGQQNRLLRHTLLACCLLVVVASVMIFAFRYDVAQFWFGSQRCGEAVALLAVGLPIVALFNFAVCWFTGRRLNRFVFRIQFTQTLFFAVSCVFVFHTIATTALSVVVAYLLSCLFGLLLATSYLCLTQSLRQSDAAKPVHGNASENDLLWRKILPFAAWVWLSNALINLFGGLRSVAIGEFLFGRWRDPIACRSIPHIAYTSVAIVGRWRDGRFDDHTVPQQGLGIRSSGVRIKPAQLDAKSHWDDIAFVRQRRDDDRTIFVQRNLARQIYYRRVVTSFDHGLLWPGGVNAGRPKVFLVYRENLV